MFELSIVFSLACADIIWFASTATAAYTLLVPPTTPYAETNPGKIEYKARLRFYAEVGTVYWQFVEPGAESTLTVSNYTEVATAYSGSIGCEEHTSGGSYYCIAVHDGLTSEIVSFTYTYEKPAGLADGLVAVDEKIATLTHETVTATADIKDGLVDIASGNTRPFSEAMSDIRAKRKNELQYPHYPKGWKWS